MCSTSLTMAGEAREEAAVDSGAVECVTSRKRMRTWTCAGGNEIKTESKVTVN